MSLLVDVVLSIQSALIFLFAGYEYLTLMHFPSLPADSEDPREMPFVSIILPARNQINTIRDCLSSLTGLRYSKKEIIVVDGHSTDGTREELENYQKHITVLEEDPLPLGWVGKCWACHLGYMKSRGQLLLFTDGDSIHTPDSLTRAVNHLQATKADLLTLAPGTILRSFWERVLQPPIFLLILLLVGGKFVNDDKRRNAIGNGQYMLFRREAYEKIGGHESVRDRIVEDYGLARLLKLAGLRLRFVIAKDALGVRMYSSLAEIWRGWRKNFYTVSENHMLYRSVRRIILYFVFLVLPFIVLGYGILLAPADILNPYLWGGAFMSILLWLGMIILNRSINISPFFALLFPLAILVYIGIGVDSTFRGLLGLGFHWKGRVYGKPMERHLGTALN